MLKHYYVSPKKRSKSQSSEASNTSDNSDTNKSGTASPSHWSNASPFSPAQEDDKTHNSDTNISTAHKSYESRLSRMRLASLLKTPLSFSNAMSYSRMRLSHLPAGASFCIGHSYGNASGNAAINDDPTSSGSQAPVRRWNSFHSTRGECHPNKFRRERKSTSPSLELERNNRQVLT